MIWLALLACVAMIAGFVWNYKRQAAAREATSAERMKAFIEQARVDSAAQSTGAVAGVTTVASLSPSAVSSAQPQTQKSQMTPPDMAVCAQAPLLNAAQLAWYRTLTRELPEHVVFAKVSLAAFVQLPEQVTGFAREAQQRRLTDAVIDFLVCDAAMRAVAAVQCSAHTGNVAQSAAFAAACVTASGVRWVEILPDTRETPETIRSLVLGA